MRHRSFLFGLAGALLAVLPARAEPPFEASCRFAEALGDRLRAPDLGMKYLDSLKSAGKVPADQEPFFAQARLNLLGIQARQEPDPVQKEALLKRAGESAQPILDRLLQPPAKGQPPPSLEEFRTVLAYYRIVQAAATGAVDAGPRLKRLHDGFRKVYQRLYDADFPDLDQKLDLQIEFQMSDGAVVLALRGAATGTGVTPQDKLQALKDGVEAFNLVRYIFDDPDRPEMVGFPAAYRGLAQCHRGIAEESSDAKALDEARKLLNAVLNNPINPSVPSAEQMEARYLASKDLLDIAFRAAAFTEAGKAVGDYRKKAGSRPPLLDRATLLGARVDMANSVYLKEKGKPNAEELRNKALAAAAQVKERGGIAASEAEALLAEWEGLSGRTRKNWKAAADQAFGEKSYEEAKRKYRAVLKTASRSNDKLLA